jgi:hypothetical protein
VTRWRRRSGRNAWTRRERDVRLLQRLLPALGPTADLDKSLGGVSAATAQAGAAPAEAGRSSSQRHLVTAAFWWVIILFGVMPSRRVPPQQQLHVCLGRALRHAVHGLVKEPLGILSRAKGKDSYTIWDTRCSR